jgi:cell division initiation protein
MEKFTKSIRGYNPKEVNSFVDEVIKQVEGMVSTIKQKDNEISVMKEKLTHYQALEMTLNKALLAAEEASEQIKKAARSESGMLIEDARRNASRIVNDALIRAEKTEYEASMLQKNINVFKRRLRSIIESQLELVDDIEHIDL